MWSKHYTQGVLICKLSLGRHEGLWKNSLKIFGRRSREKSKIWEAVRKQCEVKRGLGQGLGESGMQKLVRGVENILYSKFCLRSFLTWVVN